MICSTENRFRFTASLPLRRLILPHSHSQVGPKTPEPLKSRSIPSCMGNDPIDVARTRGPHCVESRANVKMAWRAAIVTRCLLPLRYDMGEALMMVPQPNLPQLFTGLGVERHKPASAAIREDEIAGCREKATSASCGFRERSLPSHLTRLRDQRLDARPTRSRDVLVCASIEPLAGFVGLRLREVHTAPFQNRHVEESREWAIAWRPPVGPSFHPREHQVPAVGGPAASPLDRPTGRVNPFCPSLFGKRAREQELSGLPIQNVEERVSVGPQHQFSEVFRRIRRRRAPGSGLRPSRERRVV